MLQKIDVFIGKEFNFGMHYSYVSLFKLPGLLVQIIIKRVIISIIYDTNILN